MKPFQNIVQNSDIPDSQKVILLDDWSDDELKEILLSFLKKEYSKELDYLYSLLNQVTIEYKIKLK